MHVAAIATSSGCPLKDFPCDRKCVHPSFTSTSDIILFLIFMVVFIIVNVIIITISIDVVVISRVIAPDQRIIIGKIYIGRALRACCQRGIN